MRDGSAIDGYHQRPLPAYFLYTRRLGWEEGMSAHRRFSSSKEVDKGPGTTTSRQNDRSDDTHEVSYRRQTVKRFLCEISSVVSSFIPEQSMGRKREEGNERSVKAEMCVANRGSAAGE